MTAAELNILVRVRASEAQREISRLRAELDASDRVTRRAQGNSNRPWFESLSSAGSRLQWIGRQITANLSGPILVAGGLLINNAMEQEAALARLQKLYGDTSMSQEQMKNETNALMKAFTALSNRFGVAREEVVKIAGDWAAAGSSGLALAKSVELTMRTMVVGEMEAAEATQALIAIQAQYGDNTEGLTETIYQLNAAENVSATTLKGLVTGFAKAAGVARSAGIDTRHLAAMVAALTPAAGSASEAGNSLKTMISRLMSPTGEAADVLKEMGIQLDDASWKSLTGVQRMELLSKSFEGLSESQKPVVSALVASRWQINRFEVAMRELANENGYYNKVLEATASREAVFAVAQREINTVLGTSSSRFKQAGNTIKNAFTDVMMPLLPTIAGVAQWLAKLTIKFTELSPNVQKLIGIVLLLLAAIGPLLVALGVTRLLIGQLAPMFIFLGKAVLSVFKPLQWMYLGLLAPFKLTSLLIARMAALTTAFLATSAGAYVAGVASTAWAAMTSAAAAVVGAAIIGVAKLWAFLPNAAAAAKAAMLAIWVGLGPLLLAIDAARIAAQIALAHAGAAIAIGISTAYHATIAALTVAHNYVLLTLSAGFWAVFNALQQTWWKITAAGTAAWQAIISGIHATWNAIILGATQLFWATYAAIASAGMALVNAAQKAGAAIMVAIHAAWQMVTLANLKKWAMAFVALTSGAMAGALAALKKGALAIVKFLISPWGIAIAVIVTLLAVFKEEVAQAIRNVITYFRNMPAGIKQGLQPIANVFTNIKNFIVRAFNALPDSIRNVLLKVVAVVRAAALKIYELFSYINPFARHSPSLVENVTSGMAVVSQQFVNAERSIASSAAGIYDSIRQLGDASAGLTAENEAAASAATLEKIQQTAPGAVSAYRQLEDQVKSLKSELEGVSEEIKAQEAVIEDLDRSIKAADAAIDIMNTSLEAMRKVADSVGDQLEAAKERMDYFANAQIQGMQAADDAIFQNQMAQKQLQLQMAKYKASGESVESLADSFSKLQGEIETLEGRKLELQMGGAGTDITGPYDAMIAALKQQQDALASGAAGPASELQKLQNQLDELQRQAEIMDLEKALQFDPLNRQLEQMKSNIVELPFDTIVSGYTSSRSAVDGYTAAQEAANRAIEIQESMIAAAQVARDILADKQDIEKEKLDALNESYEAYENAVRDGEQALNDMTEAADASIQRMADAAQAAEDARQLMLQGIRLGLGPNASKEMVEAAQHAKDLADAYESLKQKDKEEHVSPGLQNFRDAEGGEFGDPGKEFTIGREGGLGDQSEDIDKFTQQMMDEMGTMWGGLDPFQPLRDAWNRTWEWLKINVSPVTTSLGTMFSDLGAGIASGFKPPEGEMSKWQEIVQWFKDAWGDVSAFFQRMGELLGGLFGPDLRSTIDAVKDGLTGIWATIGPKLAELGDAAAPLWDLIKLIGAVLIPIILGIAEVFWEVLNGAIRPVFDFIGDIIGAVIDIIKGLIQIIGGIAQIIIGVFTLDWDKIKEGFSNLGKGIWEIVTAIWATIVSIIKNGATLVWNVVYGFIKGIIDFFVELWDTLVGHSIVPDTINSIVDWFMGLPGRVITFVIELVTGVISWFMELPGKIWDALLSLGEKINGAFVDAISWVMQHAPDWISGLINFFGELPGKIIGVLGDAGKWLWDFGKNMVQGLLDGAGSLLSKIGEFFLDKVPGWIKEPFKKALGIESPSKVFAEYGDNTVQGYIDGIAARSGDVEAATQAMADGAANISVPAVPLVSDIDPNVPATDAAGATTIAAGMAEATTSAQESWDMFTTDMTLSMKTFGDAFGVQVLDMTTTVASTWSSMWENMSTATTTATTTINAQLITYRDGTVAVFTQLHMQIEQMQTAHNAKMLEDLSMHAQNISDVWLASATNTLDIWTTLGDNLNIVMTDSIQPMFEMFPELLADMEESFSTTVDNVGKIWDGIKEKTAVPARFVVNDVYNSGIREAWNKVNGFLGLPALDEYIAKFAGGGAIHGKGTGTSDSILAYVGNGEHVVTEKEKRGAGGHEGIYKMRALWSQGVTTDQILANYRQGGAIPAFALGGPVDTSLWSAVSAAFPNATLNSAYRPGDSGFHGRGQAIDIGGPMQQVADWIFRTYPESAQLIWGPGPLLYNVGGQKITDQAQLRNQVYAADLPGHYDHVHWASNGAITSDGKMISMDSGSAGLGMQSYRAQVEQVFAEVMDPIRGRIPADIAGGIGKIPQAAFDKFHNDVKDFLLKKADEQDAKTLSDYGTNTGYGAGVEQWRDEVENVLRIQGRSLGLTNLTLAQMNSESSGNPNAINLWDSNAQKGTPSKGLMQVIDPTFQAYKDARFPNNIWDPQANIAAALNYVHARYPGGPQGVWGRGHGYDEGGYLQPGIIGNFSGADEPVLTHGQWGAVFNIAKSADKFSSRTVERGVIAAEQVMYGMDPKTGQAEAMATAVEEANQAWVPVFVQSSDEQVKATKAVESATKKTTTAVDRFTEVGGEIKTAVDGLSKFMLALSAAMQNPNSFGAWAPVINAAADFIESLPEQKPTYVSWAGTNQPVTEEMRRQKAANDAANLAKGGINFFRMVAPAILRSVATIGTAIEQLVASSAPIVTAAIAMFPVNPVGAAIMLIPVILQAIFTILPLIINAILDIVPALIKAIIMFLTQFMPDSVYAYDSYEAADEATRENESRIRRGASAPYFEEPVQNVQNQNTPVNVYVYQVDVNADDPEAAEVFVDNLANMGAR